MGLGTEAPAQGAPPAEPSAPPAAPAPEPQQQAPAQTAPAAPETAVEGSPEGGQPQEQDWLAQMDQRFSELRSDLDLGPTMLQPGQQPAEQQPPAAPGQQPEPGYDWAGQDFQGQQPDEYQQARQQLDTMIDERAEAKVQEALKPFHEQQNRERLVDAGLALEEQYPELREQRVAEPLFEMATGLLSEMGVQFQPDNPPAATAKIVHLLYLASKAEAASLRETAAQSGAPTGEVALEQPGARAPQGAQQQPADDGDLIVAQRGAATPFRT